MPSTAASHRIAHDEAIASAHGGMVKMTSLKAKARDAAEREDINAADR